MADLGTLLLGTFTNISDTAITGTEPVLQAIASPDDAKDVHDTSNTTHTGEASFALGDTPSDFGTMDTLFVQLRYAWQSGTQVNIWAALRARVFRSDGTTPLTNEATLALAITTETPTNSSVIQFTGVDTSADKSVWDGAVVRIYFDITKVKGGDSLEERVFAAQITGTYTAEVPSLIMADTLSLIDSVSARVATAFSETLVGAEALRQQVSHILLEEPSLQEDLQTAVSLVVTLQDTLESTEVMTRSVAKSLADSLNTADALINKVAIRMEDLLGLSDQVLTGGTPPIEALLQDSIGLTDELRMSVSQAMADAPTLIGDLGQKVSHVIGASLQTVEDLITELQGASEVVLEDVLSVTEKLKTGKKGKLLHVRLELISFTDCRR